jgi:hypothetical protein
MWEWVSSINDISKDFKLTNAANGNTVANLSAIYRSQVDYKMLAGSVGSLEPSKMIIATQTNEPIENKAWIPRDMLRAQFDNLAKSQRPAGVAVWSHPHVMSKESCDFLAAACEFSKQCETADQLICPPNVKPVQVAPGATVNLTEVYDWGIGPAKATTVKATSTKSASAAATEAPVDPNSGAVAQTASKAVMAMLMFVLGCMLLL